MRTIIFALFSAFFALGAMAEPLQAHDQDKDPQKDSQSLAMLIQDMGYENATPKLAELVRTGATSPKPIERSCVGYTPPPNCTVIFNNGSYCIERCALPTGGTIDGFCNCGAP